MNSTRARILALVARELDQMEGSEVVDLERLFDAAKIAAVAEGLDAGGPVDSELSAEDLERALSKR